ncbi:MAG TPA: TonB-dependent receptor [Rhizomicrobium sp.]|nr:TonB-dependent receptor [Rhizomicrobium sp.]
MSRFHALLLAGAALSALETSAHAQTAADSTQLAANDQSYAPATESVIVTARHAQEREQDVPISMSVVTAATLEDTGGYTLADIQHIIPGLVSYNSNPRNSSVGIRGLGVTSAQDGLDTSVGVYVDGVYLGRPGMALEDLIDVDQVEVLRGPQGTLYGRNSSAGAINITTKAPSFDPSITGEISGGSYSYNQERITATGPLIDSVLAFRLTAFNTYRDGYTANYKTGGRDNGLDRSGLRGQLLYTPLSNLSVRVIGEYSVEDDSSNTSVVTQILPDAIGTATARTKTALALTGWTPIASNSTGINAIQDMKTRQGGGSVEADYDLGWGDLTSITAYRQWEFYPLQDSDNTPLDILQVNVAKTRDVQATQEFRLASKPGDFSWQTGVFLFHQNLRDHYILNQYGYDAGAFLTNYAKLANPAAAAVTVAPGSQYLDDVRSRTDSVAAFGQFNWQIVSGLTLTGGVRFTQDWRDGTAVSSVNGTIPTSLTPAVNANLRIDGNNVSGLASLAYKLADDSLLYATYSNGYKAAGLNLDAAVPASGQVLQPEQTDNYEIGIKQGLLNDSLFVKADLYWTELSGLQANYYPPDGSKSYLTNAGNVRSRGAEVEANWTVDDHLTLGVNGAYNEAVYTSYPNAPCPVGVSGVCNLTGKPVYEAPRWVTNLNGTYGFDYDAQTRPYISAQYSFTSRYNGTIDDSPYTQIPAYGLVNLRVGASLVGGKYDVAVWANNLLDQTYYTSTALASIPGASSFGIAAQPGAPRLIGATFRANL